MSEQYWPVHENVRLHCRNGKWNLIIGSLTVISITRREGEGLSKMLEESSRDRFKRQHGREE